MSRQRRNDFLIPLLTVCSDAIALEAAFLLSYTFRFHSPFADWFSPELGVPPLRAYIISSLVFIPVWLFVFRSRRLYSPRRNAHLSDEFFAIVRVVTIGLFIVMAAIFFYREFSFSRSMFALLWVFAIVTVTAGRWCVMHFERRLYRRGRELKTVAIVGDTPTAQTIASHLTKHPELGYELIGYYAERPAASGTILSRERYLGPPAALPGQIAEYRLQAALIALPASQHGRLLELIRDAEGLNIDLMMVPDMLDLMTSHVRIQEIEGIPFLQIKEIPLSTWNRITKRTFDILVSLAVLVVTLPLTLAIAILIKLTSRGPVFFRQERLGLDGSPFDLYKFRSMRMDAEERTGPVFARKGDPRVTAIGRILRRTSLDELPQLLNVLRGNMSIVGPRPERPYFVSQFSGAVPRYLERHRVKTGMTGWAQVNGLRGNAPIEERTKYDIYYVENWSLVFDLKIILKTIHAVVFGRDAY